MCVQTCNRVLGSSVMFHIKVHGDIFWISFGAEIHPLLEHFRMRRQYYISDIPLLEDISQKNAESETNT